MYSSKERQNVEPIAKFLSSIVGGAGLRVFDQGYCGKMVEHPQLKNLVGKNINQILNNNNNIENDLKLMYIEKD